MKGKRILLTINQGLHAALKNRAESSMMTLQELITDTLRRLVLAPKNKAGRPPKSDDPYLDYFSRKR